MNLRQLLQAQLPHVPAYRLPGGFDLIGDIALITLSQEALPWAQAIGDLILAHDARIRVVAKRAGQYQGTYRLLPTEVIAGEQRLHTIHRENGILLHLDIGTVYFSPRLAHERNRIAGQVRPGEQVAVLCSGIAPFPLIIARHSMAAKILGIELNPAAHAFALKNLHSNRKLQNIQLCLGDAAQILPQQGRAFDRIILMLPTAGEKLLIPALQALKPDGMLHFYAMCHIENQQAPVDALQRACRQTESICNKYALIRCGHCAPDTDRVCLDAHISTTM